MAGTQLRRNGARDNDGAELGNCRGFFTLRKGVDSRYLRSVKKAEVQLPDAIYVEIEGLAGQLHTTVPELMRKAVEQLVLQQGKPQSKSNGQWRFPEARHLGQFGAPAQDWRLLANEDAA